MHTCHIWGQLLWIWSLYWCYLPRHLETDLYQLTQHLFGKWFSLCRHSAMHTRLWLLLHWQSKEIIQASMIYSWIQNECYMPYDLWICRLARACLRTKQRKYWINCNSQSSGYPFGQHALASCPTWISKHMPSKSGLKIAFSSQTSNISAEIILVYIYIYIYTSVSILNSPHPLTALCFVLESMCFTKPIRGICLDRKFYTSI